MLLAFSWAIVLCFIGYQYLREKEYKSDFLNAQLQQYNRHLLETVEEGLPYEDYIATHDKPFEELRISIIALSGAVVYDNTISLDSLDNHRDYPGASGCQCRHPLRHREAQSRLHRYGRRMCPGAHLSAHLWQARGPRRPPYGRCRMLGCPGCRPAGIARQVQSRRRQGIGGVTEQGPPTLIHYIYTHTIRRHPSDGKCLRMLCLVGG